MRLADVPVRESGFGDCYDLEPFAPDGCTIAILCTGGEPKWIGLLHQLYVQTVRELPANERYFADVLFANPAHWLDRIEQERTA